MSQRDEDASGTVGSWLMGQVVRLRRSEMRTWIPKPLRRLGYKLLPQRDLKDRMWRARYEDIVANAEENPQQTSVKIGIITDPMYRYGYYEAACMELGAPYELVDIMGADWMERVEGCGCDAFVVWPSPVNSVVKRMYDDRLKVLVQDLNQTLFPCYEALWLYESKWRVRDWLQAHDVPQPRTRVFFDRDRALGFVRSASYPLMFKTDLGSSAAGVEVVRGPDRAEELVDLCFGEGYLPDRHDRRDRSWGYVLFQDYIKDAREWRMVRIGDSFFGHRKVRRGQFHSGTREVAWERPPDRLLDLCRDVTDEGGFRSMNLDVLVTPEGDDLVHEMHAVFGSKHREQMLIDGRPGRFSWDDVAREWEFEEGRFCRNNSCNRRIRTVLRQVGAPLEVERETVGQEGGI